MLKSKFQTVLLALAITVTANANKKMSWPQDGVCSLLAIEHESSDQTLSLTDYALVDFSSDAIRQEIRCYETDVSFASIVVMQNCTGIIKTLLNLTKTEDGWEKDFKERHFVAAGNTRAALFLALLEAGAKPDDVFSSDYYTDTESGYIIRDRDFGKNKGNVSLIDAVDGSDCAIIRGVKSVLGNSATAAYYLSKTGIYLGDDSPYKEYDEYIYAYNHVPFDPIGLLGYKDHITPLQITAFTCGIANNGKLIMPRILCTDSTCVIYEQMCSEKSIKALRTAMRSSVDKGHSKEAYSDIIDVYGLTNVSVTNSLNESCSLFTGFAGNYTITVNLVMKSNNPNIEIAPCRIAKKIIDYLTCNNNKDISPSNRRFHPAERGR